MNDMGNKLTERNYGIDILRLFSMFMIVILHVCGHGGILEHTTGANYYFALTIRTVSMCAVDCFAMISGFVGYRDDKETYSYAKYIKLWLPVFFYSVLISILYYVFFSATFEIKNLIRAFVPVTCGSYWYFTAYTAVFFTAPLINKIVRDASLRELNIFAFVGMLVFSVYSSVHLYLSPLWLSEGYNALWLIILYFIGAWVKKSNLPKILKLKFSILLSILIMVVMVLEKIVFRGIISTYVSPFVVALSIIYICIFSKIKVGKHIKRFTSTFAPAAFGVYLLHDNSIIRDNFMKKVVFDC